MHFCAHVDTQAKRSAPWRTPGHPSSLGYSRTTAILPVWAIEVGALAHTSTNMPRHASKHACPRIPIHTPIRMFRHILHMRFCTLSTRMCIHIYYTHVCIHVYALVYIHVHTHVYAHVGRRNASLQRCLRHISTHMSTRNGRLQASHAGFGDMRR